MKIKLIFLLLSIVISLNVLAQDYLSLNLAANKPNFGLQSRKTNVTSKLHGFSSTGVSFEYHYNDTLTVPTFYLSYRRRHFDGSYFLWYNNRYYSHDKAESSKKVYFTTNNF